MEVEFYFVLLMRKILKVITRIPTAATDGGMVMEYFLGGLDFLMCY